MVFKVYFYIISLQFKRKKFSFTGFSQRFGKRTFKRKKKKNIKYIMITRMGKIAYKYIVRINLDKHFVVRLR